MPHIHIHIYDQSTAGKAEWGNLSWENLLELERQRAFWKPTIRPLIPEYANKRDRWDDECSCHKNR